MVDPGVNPRGTSYVYGDEGERMNWRMNKRKRVKRTSFFMRII